MVYGKKVFSKGLKAKQKATDVRIYIKKDEIASVSKRIVEYDRFIRSASHVNIYALLVFFLSSLVSFVRYLLWSLSHARSLSIIYALTVVVSGILYVFTLLAACTCVLFCRWFLGEWVSERESLGFQRDAIQNILCIPIHESERPFKFHYDFQHLDCWTALKMNTNSLYGLAHSIYTYITKLLLSIVFWS